MSVYIPWWLMIAPALVVSAGLTMALALILIRVWFIVVDRALHLARDGTRQYVGTGDSSLNPWAARAIAYLKMRTSKKAEAQA